MQSTPNRASPVARLRPRAILAMVYVVGFGSAYWLNFIWFYLHEGWGLRPATNLLLNAGFGFFYTVGCVGVSYLVRRWIPRHMLFAGFGGLIAITLVCAGLRSAAAVGAIVLIHGLVVAMTWPILEMLISVGHRGAELGRAIGRYNIAWALTSAVSYAVAGIFFELHWLTFFLIPSLCWAASILLVARVVPPFADPLEVDLAGDPGPETRDPRDKMQAPMMKSLTRMGNMTSYILISSLIPIMPAVAEGHGLGLRTATVFAAVWVGARVIGFSFFGRWQGWHFRPRLFLAVLFGLPFCFAAVVIAPWFALSVAAQVALGLACAFIYTNALFYSMHGQAKTSEAAYHEAVIGVGYTAGPLLAAAGGYLGERVGLDEKLAIVVTVSTILLLLWVVIAWRWRRAPA